MVLRGVRDKAEPAGLRLVPVSIDGAYPREPLPEPPGGENLDRYAVGD